MTAARAQAQAHKIAARAKKATAAAAEAAAKKKAKAAKKAATIASRAAREKVRQKSKGVATIEIRAVLQRISRAILGAQAKEELSQIAARLGVVAWDIKNLRANNLPGLQLMLRLVRKGRFSPRALIEDGKLQKLSANFSTTEATRRAITKRICALAATLSATKWSQKSRLSYSHVYSLRRGKNVGLRTVIAFILSGADVNELFFGARSKH